MRIGTAVVLVVLVFVTGIGSALAQPAPEEGEVKEGWFYDEGLHFRSKRFVTLIGARPQFRFSVNQTENTDTNFEFTIPRFKLFAGGWIGAPWLFYRIQFDAHGQNDVTNVIGVDTDGDGNINEIETTESQSFKLDDLFLDLARVGMAAVRVGQFKIPFGIQFLTSSGQLRFVKRAIASQVFAPKRDQGVMLMGLTSGGRFGYDVGILNGSGSNQSSNDNNKPLYVARVHLDPNGFFDLEDTAFQAPRRPELTLGVAWFRDYDDLEGELVQDNYEAYFEMRFRMIALLADYYVRFEDRPGGGEIESRGYIAEIGFFPVPERLQIGLRSSEVEPDVDTPKDVSTETGVAINYYFYRTNRFKIQVDYRLLKLDTTTGEIEDEAVQAQLQIIF